MTAPQEGEQRNYLTFLKRIPGRTSPTKKHPQWVVLCQLCGQKTVVRWRGQLSCGCIHHARFKEIHHAYLRAKVALERVTYIRDATHE